MSDHPAGYFDPQSTPPFEQTDGTPALDDENEVESHFSSPAQNFETHKISRIHDVKLDGPDERVKNGYKNFLEYQGTAKHMLTVGEASKEDLEKAARENAAFAFNEGYLKPLQDIATPASVKKQITDALLDRAHGKVGTDVNVKLSGAVGVVTISNEDIARLIAVANERAADGSEAVVISE